MKKAYDAYADFVHKNPFQDKDQPIKGNELFDDAINSAFN